jgi:hypothetical protein
MTEIFNSRRRFQMWRYTVGHSELLLRSIKSGDSSTRIDVFFKNVHVMHLPTIFEGLIITELSHEESRGLSILPFQGTAKVFGVRGATFAGYVVAGVVAFHEDEGEYNDPSFFSKNNNI